MTRYRRQVDYLISSFQSKFSIDRGIQNLYQVVDYMFYFCFIQMEVTLAYSLVIKWFLGHHFSSN